MKKSKKNIAQIRKKFTEMDERLLVAAKDLKKMKQFSKELPALLKNMKAMSDYYHSEWLADREKFHKDHLHEHFNSAGEDPIWIATAGCRELSLEITKMLVLAL